MVLKTALEHLDNGGLDDDGGGTNSSDLQREVPLSYSGGDDVFFVFFYEHVTSTYNQMPFLNSAPPWKYLAV